jgi:hypothetical protein
VCSRRPTDRNPSNRLSHRKPRFLVGHLPCARVDSNHRELFAHKASTRSGRQMRPAPANCRFPSRPEGGSDGSGAAFVLKMFSRRPESKTKDGAREPARSRATEPARGCFHAWLSHKAVGENVRDGRRFGRVAPPRRPRASTTRQMSAARCRIRTPPLDRLLWGRHGFLRQPHAEARAVDFVSVCA